MSDPARPLPEEHPVFHHLREAPLDDEPLTEEDIAAIRRARADVKAGRTYTDAEVSRILGE